MMLTGVGVLLSIARRGDEVEAPDLETSTAEGLALANR
jgi:hypothetical protein